MGHQRVGVLAEGMLVDAELELMSVDAPLEVEPAVPEAPMDVPLPVVVSVLLPVPLVEAVLPDVVESVLGVAAVLGAVGVVGAGVVVLEVVDEVEDSVVRSPQAARVSAAITARAAQRARGVGFIRTLLAVREMLVAWTKTAIAACR
jgi:hypothetical protein